MIDIIENKWYNWFNDFQGGFYGKQTNADFPSLSGSERLFRRRPSADSAKIIDILSDEYDLVVERKAIGRNVSYLKEMGFEIEGDKKESILQAALSRTRNSVFLSTAF